LTTADDTDDGRGPRRETERRLKAVAVTGSVTDVGFKIRRKGKPVAVEKERRIRRRERRREERKEGKC
jgi:hypothetical protein